MKGIKIHHKIQHLGCPIDAHVMESNFSIENHTSIDSALVEQTGVQKRAKILNANKIKATLFGDIKESIRKVIEHTDKVIMVSGKQECVRQMSRTKEMLLNTFRIIEEKIDDNLY